MLVWMWLTAVVLVALRVLTEVIRSSILDHFDRLAWPRTQETPWTD